MEAQNFKFHALEKVIFILISYKCGLVLSALWNVVSFCQEGR